MIKDILNEQIEEKEKIIEFTEYINKLNEKEIQEEIFDLRREKISKSLKIDIYTSIIKLYDSKQIAELIDFNIALDIELGIEEYYSIIEKIYDIYPTKEYRSYYKHTIKKIVNKDINIYNRVFYYLTSETKAKIDLGCQLYVEAIENYKKMSKLLVERRRLILGCKKISYIITVYNKNTLKFFLDLNKQFTFTKEELSSFLDSFMFNYPYDCEDFLEKCGDDSSYFIRYMKEYICNFERQNKIRESIKDIQPFVSRVNLYGKRKHEQMKEIRETSKKSSVFLQLFKTKTILYGNKFVINNEHYNSFPQTMKKISYYYTLPVEYSIDSVLFYKKSEHIIYNDRGEEL